MTPHQRSSAEAATAQAGDNLTPLHLELTDAHLRKLRKIRRRFFKSSQDLGCVALWALNMALLHHEHTIGQIEAFVRYRADEGFTIEDSDRLLHSRLTR